MAWRVYREDPDEVALIFKPDETSDLWSVKDGNSFTVAHSQKDALTGAGIFPETLQWKPDPPENSGNETEGGDSGGE